MALTFLEKELKYVELQASRFWQRHAIRRRRARCGLSNPQGTSVPDGSYLRDRRVSIQYRNRVATPHGSQVLAEASLELSDPDFLHLSIVTINGHIGKAANPLTSHRRVST
jgi:hypothetical protein